MAERVLIAYEIISQPDGEVVHRIDLRDGDPTNRVYMGLARQMDSSRFYIGEVFADQVTS